MPSLVQHAVELSAQSGNGTAHACLTPTSLYLHTGPPQRGKRQQPPLPGGGEGEAGWDSRNQETWGWAVENPSREVLSGGIVRGPWLQALGTCFTTPSDFIYKTQL